MTRLPVPARSLGFRNARRRPRMGSRVRGIARAEPRQGFPGLGTSVGDALQRSLPRPPSAPHDQHPRRARCRAALTAHRAVTAWALVFALASGAHAHQVSLTQARGEAVVLTLRYADATPFAYESYELYPPGEAEVPAQVGRTDAAGRVAFVPGVAGEWRVKAFTGDGHGVDRTIRVRAAAGAEDTAAPPAAGPGVVTALVTGLAVLFGLFGLYQLFLRTRGRP